MNTLSSIPKRRLTVFALAVLTAVALTSIALAQNTTYLLPGSFFDKDQAAMALQKGSSAIQGVAYTRGTLGNGGLIGNIKVGRKKFASKGTVVTLFPMTPYFAEYFELRKKHPPGGKKVAVIPNEAYEYRLTATVLDDNGNFYFENLKPGKYMIEASVSYTKTGSYSVETGREVGYNVYGQEVSSTPLYSSYSTSWVETDHVSEVVSVPEEEVIVEVNLH